MKRRKRPALQPSVQPAPPDNREYPRWMIERAFPDPNKRPQVNYRRTRDQFPQLHEKRI